MSRKTALRVWLERLQSQGRYSFTGSEARDETGLSSEAFQSALGRLVAKGRVASPRQGFHVVVPPEYRSLGCLPASWFIDDMMEHMDTPYYVGLLTAAALHGAAHQRPMEFQVVVDRPLRPISCGRVRVHFIESSRLPTLPAVRMRTETGYMNVSTPEATAFDLVHYYHHAGSLSNAATVLGELAESLDPQALVEAAPLFSRPDVQRLGHMLENYGSPEAAEKLLLWLRSVGFRKARLRPDLPEGNDSPYDPEWKLILNDVLEPDL